jgi:predicted DNA-binding protein (MmcQ/YjbR family)
MTNETIREHCLGLPHATEVVRWEDHLLFKVGGKMFAIIALDGHSCSIRCTPESYADLVEMADIVPASHNMWKYHWVTTETLTALPDREFRELLTASYRIVRASLPRGVQAALDGGAKPAAAKSGRKKAGSRATAATSRVSEKAGARPPARRSRAKAR